MAGKRRGGKKIAKFSKKMQKKLVVLFVIIALLLLGLIVRLNTPVERNTKRKYYPSRNMTVRSFLISVEILQTARERYWQPAWMYTM